MAICFLVPFVFWCHLFFGAIFVYLMAIWSFLLAFWYTFPILVCFTKKNRGVDVLKTDSFHFCPICGKKNHLWTNGPVRVARLSLVQHTEKWKNIFQMTTKLTYWPKIGNKNIKFLKNTPTFSIPKYSEKILVRKSMHHLATLRPIAFPGRRERCIFQVGDVQR
jgi:hypothetical protein